MNVEVHATTRRIVLVSKEGLWYIGGLLQEEPPVTIHGLIWMDGHTSSADLFKSTKRMHVYQERV